LLPGGQGFVIHVSRLATHTQDMLVNAAVGLLVIAVPDPAGSPLALPRVSVRGNARQCWPEAAEYEEARAAYLAKLPQSDELFSFSDFSLFIIEIRSLRFVAGFGRAVSVTPGQFATVMSAPR
jgi:putative heme iron utilization protein